MEGFIIIALFWALIYTPLYGVGFIATAVAVIASFAIGPLIPILGMVGLVVIGFLLKIFDKEDDC